MVSRLVLGCGRVGRAVADGLRERAGDLVVLGGEESRVTAVREEGVPAHVCDLSAPNVLSEYDPTSVVVATGDQATDRAAASAVRSAFPDVHLVVCSRDADRFDGLADAVVDPGTLIGGRVLDLVDGDPETGHAGVYARRFRETLRSLSGPLAVVMHDNPDPDAIGSAVALAALARRTGLAATPCYFGEINHQENRALVNLLDLELRALEAPEEIEAFGGVALVDHARPGVNDQLPPGTRVDMVVDHHPPRGPVEAGFVDLRQGVGATSTILADYHRRLGASFDPEVATALLYGIRVDTDDFVREVSPVDFEAAAALLPDADLAALDRVESPSVSPDTFETMAAAIRNRRVEGAVLVSYAGDIPDRDALAQAADTLLGMADIDTVLVFGTTGEMIYASARARGDTPDLGATMRSAFGRIGSAGGHGEMAGAQIPLGSLAELPDEGDDWRAVVESVIAERFLETVRAETRPVEDLPPGAIPAEHVGDVAYGGDGEYGDDGERDASGRE